MQRARAVRSPCSSIDALWRCLRRQAEQHCAQQHGKMTRRCAAGTPSVHVMRCLMEHGRARGLLSAACRESREAFLCVLCLAGKTVKAPSATRCISHARHFRRAGWHWCAAGSLTNDASGSRGNAAAGGHVTRQQAAPWWQSRFIGSCFGCAATCVPGAATATWCSRNDATSTGSTGGHP